LRWKPIHYHKISASWIPFDKLKKNFENCPNSRQAAVIISIGSLNLVHTMHFEIIYLVKTYLEKNGCIIVAGFMSPIIMIMFTTNLERILFFQSDLNGAIYRLALGEALSWKQISSTQNSENDCTKSRY